jgi:hypothetical protein
LNLTPKTCAVETAEKRNSSCVIATHQNCDRAHLRNRLTHQYTGQSWSTRKMTCKKPFIASEMPRSRRRDTGLNRSDDIDKQKRRSMGQHINW